MESFIYSKHDLGFIAMGIAILWNIQIDCAFLHDINWQPSFNKKMHGKIFVKNIFWLKETRIYLEV
jgi:hypothetical protein